MELYAGAAFVLPSGLLVLFVPSADGETEVVVDKD